MLVEPPEVPAVEPEALPTEPALPSDFAPTPFLDDGAAADLGDFGAPAPRTARIASAFGGSSAAAGVPGMIGDFCGIGPMYPVPVVDIPNDEFPDFQQLRTRLITVPLGGGRCLHKQAEFSSTCPLDRVFFTFNHYNNGVVDFLGNPEDVDRSVFGFEKTFLNKLGSFELRVPFAGGLESNQIVGDTLGGEFGNLATTLKLLLINNRRFAVSAGNTMVWPTADDASILFDSSDPMSRLFFENEEIRALPFLAFLHKPNSLVFHQGIVQVDFQLQGNKVGTPLSGFVDLDDPTLLFLDYSLGLWLYESRYGPIRRVASLLELHYTSTLEDTFAGVAGVAGLDGRRDILNIIGGLHVQLGNRTQLRVASGAPLRTGTDRAFDSELSVQVARHF